jgi:hypothetical protein
MKHLCTHSTITVTYIDCKHQLFFSTVSQNKKKKETEENNTRYCLNKQKRKTTQWQATRDDMGCVLFGDKLL